MPGRAWPWAVQRTTTMRQPAGGQRKPGKSPQTGETTYQKDYRPGRAREYPGESPTTECCTGQQRLERVVDSDDRKRRRRVENGRGPVPEVSCNPPARYPRPPFALQRETYRLELRGSCGRVQAVEGLLGLTQAVVAGCSQAARTLSFRAIKIYIFILYYYRFLRFFLGPCAACFVGSQAFE